MHYAADLILLLHAALTGFEVLFPLYVMAGYRRNWPRVRNLALRALHLVILSIIVTQSWFGITCPLTTWEMTLRTQVGSAIYRESFIRHWVAQILFYRADENVFIGIYSAFALLVGWMWWHFPARRNRARTL